MQTSTNILLVRPANFMFNAETEVSNAFQTNIADDKALINKKVLAEFDEFSAKLTSKGVNVYVFEDTKTPIKPDAIFPNNWVTFHANGTVILYPMQAVNRQYERRLDIIEQLKESFAISNVIDFSEHEKNNQFLEGTGSIIFDHIHQKAYACLSPRTHKDLFIQLCQKINYQPVYFYSVDDNNKEIYHTNVMMCIGEKFAVVCLESIKNAEEKALVVDNLSNTNHQIIDISFNQMKQFAGNMLEVNTKGGNKILVLSQTAYNSLTINQQQEISKYCEFLPMNINTIESIGGGSARCMMAEIFLPTASK